MCGLQLCTRINSLQVKFASADKLKCAFACKVLQEADALSHPARHSMDVAELQLLGPHIIHGPLALV